MTARKKPVPDPTPRDRVRVISVDHTFAADFPEVLVRKIGTNVIEEFVGGDNYQFHWPDMSKVPVRTVSLAMERIAGIIRFLKSWNVETITFSIGEASPLRIEAELASAELAGNANGVPKVVFLLAPRVPDEDSTTNGETAPVSPTA